MILDTSPNTIIDLTYSSMDDPFALVWTLLVGMEYGVSFNVDSQEAKRRTTSVTISYTQVLWGEPGPHPPAVTFFFSATQKFFFLFADHHRKLINFDPSNQPNQSVLRRYLYWQLCLLMFYWSG
jgi:hypothetical protein